MTVIERSYGIITVNVLYPAGSRFGHTCVLVAMAYVKRRDASPAQKIE
jgi:hypothetical protein